ncbi:MAG: hypothetical protein CMF22_10165 [Idiomarinaceae bacterium]|nr:hypothetical protein [Idiomarinaceae bacterium]MBG23806.1 hypothetical protein [Idiomarinaceae bacterium]|tara:strand:+ start:40782 stop:41003 length:222 start_codon:yes stop_codon:yes gene_type:complete
MNEQQMVELRDQAQPLIELLEEQCSDLGNYIEHYAIANPEVTVKDIDEIYRQVKATCRELNKLAKDKRKLMEE